MSHGNIPTVIRLDLAYRDHSNYRKCSECEFSNTQGLAEDIIYAAFEKMGHSDIIPYQFGLPCDLATTLHPDEPTYRKSAESPAACCAGWIAEIAKQS